MNAVVKMEAPVVHLGGHPGLTFEEAHQIPRFVRQALVLGRDGCWEWIGSYNGTGRGQFKYTPHPNPDKDQTGRKGRTVTAPRASYMLFIGPIPDGMFVCHRCDNSRCVNPYHLWLGTAEDNMRDMREKGRAFWQRTTGERPRAEF